MELMARDSRIHAYVAGVSGEAEDTAEHGHGVLVYGQTELAVLGV